MATAFLGNASAQLVPTASSKATFSISNFGVNTVEGSFSGMRGTVKFTKDIPAKGTIDICLPTASVDTDNEKRDDHLRSADYFDAEHYPEICFKSSGIVQTSNGFLAKGNLQMHGVIQNVAIPFTYSGQTITGTLVLKRLDYKIGEDTNTFMMGNEVEVTIVCVLEE